MLLSSKVPLNSYGDAQSIVYTGSLFGLRLTYVFKGHFILRFPLYGMCIIYV